MNSAFPGAILLCVLPARGHLQPTLPVIDGLVAAGYRVLVLTGTRFADTVRAHGAQWVPLPQEADFDEVVIPRAQREQLSGVRLARTELGALAALMEPQLTAVRQVLDREHVGAVLCDPLFLAGLALTRLPRAERPPVLVLGFVPLSVPMPGRPTARGPLGRATAAAERLALRRMLAPVQRTADRQARTLTGRSAGGFFMDWPLHADGVLQMTCAGLEPQRRWPMPVHFVGPLLTSRAGERSLPAWWAQVTDPDTRVVLVTQGGVAGSDPEDLLLPTMRALQDEDVVVVVSTGGVELDPASVPANARLADWLPYDDLLPHCALLVTNGGYGGVNHALRHGVPIVCIGASEDKRAVAQRVAAAGAGVGITRGRASTAMVGKAIRRVLGDGAYRMRARELAEEIAGSPGVPGVVAVVEEAVDAQRRW